MNHISRWQRQLPSFSKGIRTPPASELVIAELRSCGLAAGRVGRPVWGLILSFVGGAEPLDSLLQPSLHHFAAGGPASQLWRANKVIANCSQSLQRLRRTTEPFLREHVEGQNGQLDGDDSSTEEVPLWLIAARADLAAGHLVGGMPATLVREEADQWWTLALEIYGNGCVCGRSIKPTIYCKCRLPFVLVCPLMPRYHTHCCRECARYDGRSAQQNRRRRSSHGLECELRYDASARPAIFDLMSDRADETRELRIVKVIDVRATLQRQWSWQKRPAGRLPLTWN